MSELINQLVATRGIESNFVDAWGRPTVIDAESKEKLLMAMGYHTQDKQKLEHQVDTEIISQWLTPLNPVQVIRQSELIADGDSKLYVIFRVPITYASDTHEFCLTTENGQLSKVNIIPADTELLNVCDINGIDYHEYAVTLPLLLDTGYHRLEVTRDSQEVGESRIIIAPDTCYTPSDIQQGKKIWGLSVQLYCLRSRTNWGIGDFSDLATLIKGAAVNGADFIGLNPIHALYPSVPSTCSPYGPSSRQWLNVLYIDVSVVEKFNSNLTQAWCLEQNLEAQLNDLRHLDYVDYDAVASIKIAALRIIFNQYHTSYLTKNTAQNKAFKAFVKKGGESLETLATFEALQASLKEQGKECWGWPVFPGEYKDVDLPQVQTFKKNHKREIQFYMFLQWIAAQQFEDASAVAKNAGMLIGLYRDLAVGVSEGSAEIWGNKSLYCTQASIGAPPDVLGPLGQTWGLPPINPEQLYQQEYQPIVDLFAANMFASGALRIDHVMALLRLWWVYKGDSADKGGYVYYPVDDLLGILALESQRNQSLVIGEDLGTVPDEIREKLAQNGVYSYRVFFFEQAEDGGFYSPSHYPVQSMSTLTTHDMPTLSGFWHCDDLALGKDVGLYPDEDVLASLYLSRHNSKQQVLNSLHGHQSIDDRISNDVHNLAMTTALNHGLQKHMASGSSALLSLQLEDWLQMDKPVNVPGTFNEYPNWKRKLTRNLEDIFADQELNSLAKELTKKRIDASNPS